MALKVIKIIIWILIVFFGLIGLIAFFFTSLNEVYFNTSHIIDPKLAADFGSFFGGFIGTLFTIISVLFILLTIIIQNIESKKSATISNFFKMVDYHNTNVSQLKISDIKTAINKKRNIQEKDKIEGRRAFVIFKLQLRELIKVVREINLRLSLKYNEEQIADIAYIAFYYGIDKEWSKYSIKKLSKYKRYKELYNELFYKVTHHRKKIGRTNQTSLSSYFRNMYNAIKLIDSDDFLSKKEKNKYVKILRAQISNPELYIIFFNLLSRFGTKWKENNYVIKYEFIKNIPLDYLTGYNPKHYFDLVYEEEEQNV